MCNATPGNLGIQTLEFLLEKNARIFSYYNEGKLPVAPSNQWHQRHSAKSTFQLLSTVGLDPPFSSSRRISVRCSTSQAAGEDTNPRNQNSEGHSSKNFWRKWKMDTTKMSSEIAKLGLAAILAYGLFDGVTYTSFFVLAFTGYEKSTGKNPAANLQALLGIVILMWTGNNITRPFRVAGAAALAPLIDKGLKRIQNYLRLPSLVFAFALVVTIVAVLCFTVVGLLILSRWGK